MSLALCASRVMGRVVCRRSVRPFSATAAALDAEPRRRRTIPTSGPSLADFASPGVSPDDVPDPDTSEMNLPHPLTHAPPGPALKFAIETMGCQMNVSDSEIVSAVLTGAGYEQVATPEEADVMLINTCAIRDNAEAKVWHRLDVMRVLKRTRKAAKQGFVVGVLGCMAERLKKKLLETDKTVDVVVGPDAYRDLPRLLSIAQGGEQAINVQLSLDETYADITPVRADPNSVSSFVSIMRGCDNHCAFCIVPRTRGRERSRKLDTIVDEVRHLADEGVKDVVLCGQNVNSYHQLIDGATHAKPLDAEPGYVPSPGGFSNNYSRRGGAGPRFVDLLDAVSAAVPEVRLRFTSPHPKDFPEHLLQLIADRPNISNSIHMPVQSGSTSVLEAMRRGYTREAFLTLVDVIRATIPNVSISTDILSGFCGETDADHADTLGLMEQVRFDQAFMFAYSNRPGTLAARRLQDDVPEPVKLQRLQDVIDVFQTGALERHTAEIGNRHLVLLECPSRRSTPSNPEFLGRTHNNKRCIVKSRPVPPSYKRLDQVDELVPLVPGDFVVADVVRATSASLIADPVARSSITEYHSM